MFQKQKDPKESKRIHENPEGSVKTHGDSSV